MDTCTQQHDPVDASLAELEELLRTGARRPAQPRLALLSPGRRTLFALALFAATLAGVFPLFRDSIAAAVSVELRVSVAYMRHPTVTIDETDTQGVYRLGSLTPDPWGSVFRYEPALTHLKPQSRIRYSTGPNRIDEKGLGDDIPLTPSPDLGLAWNLAHGDAWLWVASCLFLVGGFTLPLLTRPRGSLRLEICRAIALASLPTILGLGVAILAWNELSAVMPAPFPSNPGSALVTIVAGSVGLAFVVRALVSRGR